MIELELSRGRNAMGIWQDLVDTHGFTGGYQSVKRLVRKLRGAVSPEARVIIETRPAGDLWSDGTETLLAVVMRRGGSSPDWTKEGPSPHYATEAERCRQQI